MAPVAGLARDHCEHLADLGLMFRGHSGLNRNRYYFVTDAGAKFIGFELPKD